MIKQAAISVNGMIFRGKRHKDIKMRNKHIFGINSGTEGFVTNAGLFVDRKEAAKIAYMCGQIKSPVDKLKSEHLY